MGEQLDVFLGQQTTPFLTELFEVISSGVYLQGSTQTTTTSDATAEVNTNSIASPSQEPMSCDVVVEKADILRQSASKALNDTQNKQNRRTSPVRATDNQTNNDNNADYVSGSFKLFFQPHSYTYPNILVWFYIFSHM